MTRDEVFKLIEDNGLTLHGDIEHFASLVADHLYAKYLEPPTPSGADVISVTVQEPVAWDGYNLEDMCEAFDRVIEEHHQRKNPFHDPVNKDAMIALRVLRGFVPYMKLYTTPPAVPAPVQEPVAYLCENAVGHKYFRWKKPSSTYKPIPLYTRR